jgi:hypothetical protein
MYQKTGGHKIYQNGDQKIPNGHEMRQSLPFWYENIPSGNPGLGHILGNFG